MDANSFRGKLPDGPLRECKSRLVAILSRFAQADRRDSVDDEAAEILFVGAHRALLEQITLTKPQVAAARKSLRRAADKALELQDLLMAMPRDALEAISLPRPSYGSVKEMLDRIAAGKLEPLPAWYPTALVGVLDRFVTQALGAEERLSVEANAGRPGNPTASMIAKQAAQSYERLTGKRASVSKRYVPTTDASGAVNRRGGPFVRFLGEVFAALEIEADPAYFAEKARKA